MLFLQGSSSARLRQGIRGTVGYPTVAGGVTASQQRGAVPGSSYS
jgi:hypothetical protein